MKRRKLFYVPGMISLLVVPVLFYFYQPVIKTTTLLRLFVPNDDSSSDRYTFSRYTVIATLKGKKINTVYLDGGHTLNAKKLEFVAYEALKLEFYHDTTQVIKVRFSAETNYNEFVQLVNIMYRNDHKRYAWVDNDFYIFGEPPPEPQIEHPVSCLLCNDVIITEKQKTWQEKLSEQINKYGAIIINNKWLLSAFVLLIIVPAVLNRKA